MNKLIKSLLFLLTILFLFLFYVTFFGIETNRLNNKIKKEISNINENLELELKTIRVLLSPLDLKINVKTLGSNIKVNNKKIELESIKTKISLPSFIKNEFSLDNIEIATKLIKVKDLISLSKSLNNSTELIILDKFTKSGNLMTKINLNFDNKGRIKDDYYVEGFLKDLKFNFLNKYSLKNLDLTFKIHNKKYQIENIKMNLNKINLSSENIVLEQKNDEFLIKGKINSSEQVISKSDIINFDINTIKNLDLDEINFSSQNIFDFKINKKFRIENLNFESELNLKKLKYTLKSSLNKYFPKFNNEVFFKDHKIIINKKNKQLNIKGKGKILLQDNSDEISYDITKKNDLYNFETTFSILKNEFLVDYLGYIKDPNSNAKLNIKGKFKKNNEIEFESIFLEENKNKFLISNLFLNDKFKVLKVDSVKIDFLNKDKIKNKIEFVNKNNNYILNGSSFDANKIIDNIISSDQKNEISKILNIENTNIKININKVYLDPDNYVNDFTGEIILKKNKIHSLNLNSLFSKNEKLTLTIKDINNEKVTTLYSARAKPIVKRYKFIKGFEEGSLDFYSTKKNDLSNSQIRIYDFKLQELPVLTKILTLASLQGIADLLSGQGIRFNEFEMNFSNKESLMTINEIYALGPAISILMDGYIEKDRLISLRGTLVPATTINKVIGSIPILGDILVGKKVGEGVFGVSFKIKGPPNNLQTSVNPIKTLTPRFITRTLEKIKKN
jgi:hypothetical protein